MLILGKRLVSRIVPEQLRRLFSGVKYHILQQKKTPRVVFSEIYQRKEWGGSNEIEFYSGAGSSLTHIVQPYLDKVSELLSGFRFKPRVVDLGCGDFCVGKNLIKYADEYIAADCVPELIEKHKKEGYPQHVRFLCLDIVRDALPDGDICFLRQVLQHLSNKEIRRILSKLKKYKMAIITEHYPADNPRIRVNEDIVHGPNIRIFKNSGVYLDCPPFNISKRQLQLMLAVPAPAGAIEGVIRTYKVQYSTALTELSH
jgi:SAM-dependent methyltransferase